MKNNLYVVYDNVGRRYGQVYAYPSDGYALLELRPLVAVRDKQTGAVLEKESIPQFSRYVLCRVGEIDIESGTVSPQSPVRLSWSDTPYLETKAVDVPADLPLGSSK
jgi:hypothetical protein